MRFLRVAEVLALHRRVVEQAGGAPGVRDLGALESAVEQPKASFAGTDLSASLPEKAAALGFSIVSNHPIVDGTSARGKPRWRSSSS